jgi:imidazole glycerol phosphate synthase glutamine amidotransferase subunit
MIGIIDYGAGNLGSVKKAFDYLEVPNMVIDSTASLESAKPAGIVLPGVGAFGAAAEKLKDKGFFPILKKYIAQNRPFLGICLGMQLLMESSEEANGAQGLGIIKGTCRRFQQGKVPQIGWNRVNAEKDSRLFKGIPRDSFFYFVHSFYVDETDPSIKAGSTRYYIPFTSAFESGNLCALQFHPEKSGEKGLQILRNWVDALDCCYLPPAARGSFEKPPLDPAKLLVRGKPAPRIIPCLDVDNGRVVKGIKFKDIRDAGDPAELAQLYNQQGADEITFLDIGATHKSREILLDVVEKVSRKVFVPLTVGGGLSTITDMRKVLNAGADKVSICSAAIRNPALLTQAARLFGSQCIVLSIDAKRVGNSWHAFVNGGRIDTRIDALEWAKKGETLGAGEILLNSIDRDGTHAGYDLELTRKVSQSVNIPVIASGGAGSPEHMTEAVNEGKADAVLLASLLHDRQLSLPRIKKYLDKKGVNVRWQ